MHEHSFTKICESEPSLSHVLKMETGCLTRPLLRYNVMYALLGTCMQNLDVSL